MNIDRDVVIGVIFDCIDETSCPPVPIADFSCEPSSGPAPLNVHFVNNSSGDIDTCEWDFGDGTTIITGCAGQDHTYTVPGTYTATLTVNGPGGTDTVECTIEVTTPIEELERQFGEAFGVLIEVFRPIFQPVVETDVALRESLEEAINTARQLPGTTERIEIQFTDILCILIDLVCISKGVPCFCFITEGCFSIGGICIPTDIKLFEVTNSPTTTYQLFSFDLLAQIEKTALELFIPGDRFVTNIPFLGSEPSFSIAEVKSVVDSPEFGVVEFSITGVSFVSVTVPCDLDGDGVVDYDDYLIFRSTLGKCSGDAGYIPEADFDEDGCISYRDYRLWYLCYRDNQ